MIRSMIVFAAMLAAMFLNGVARAQTTQPAEASENPYVVDFTKTRGDYSIASAEGKHVPGEGLKLTDLKTTGGPMLEGKTADLSATPIAVVELENKGGEEVSLFFKVKSPEKAYTKDKLKAEPGKSTLKIDLRKADVDLKELNYVKLFGDGKVDLLVKSITFTKAQ